MKRSIFRETNVLFASRQLLQSKNCVLNTEENKKSKKLYKDDSDVVISEVAAGVHSSRVDTKQRAAAPSSAARRDQNSAEEDGATISPERLIKLMRIQTC